MRSIFRNIVLSAAAVSAMAACTDDRNNFMVDDSFGFNNAAGENVNELAVYSGAYEIAVIKSGKGQSGAVVYVENGADALTAYNEENDTEYVSVPESSYTFSAESLDYKAEDVSKTITVNWNVEEVSEFMAANPEKECVIPVSLRSDDLEVNEGRHLVILNLKKTSVTTEQKLISWTLQYGSGATPVADSKNITINLDRTPGMALSLTFSDDEDAVAAYNEANRVNYKLAPEGLFSYDGSVTIAAGELIAQLPVAMNSSVLFTDGVLGEFAGYVLPVRVSEATVDGIVYDETLTYIVVKGMAPAAPQLFDRLWGLYTTGAASPWWGTNFVMPSSGNPDRNIAMDDEYVYVSQSGSTAAIKAFSITDPSVVKSVDMTGVSGGTHLISCVRVIKNEDPEVNGGKDILIATNLGINDAVYLYAWTNGIDAAPVRKALVNTWRRIGDKFTVVGTWQQGELRFVDYQASQQAVVRFRLSNGEPTGGTDEAGSYWPDGKYDINTGSTSDRIGECTMYPGSTQYALMNSNQAGVFATFSTGTEYVGSSWTADPSLALTFGYNFFSENGQNYIAYFQLDPDTHAQGKVVVLKDADGTAEGFKNALEAQDVVFSAPIQDAMDASIVSPTSANPWIGDCTVRKINGAWHMAVLQNGGGLSLFKMNSNL